METRGTLAYKLCIFTPDLNSHVKDDEKNGSREGIKDLRSAYLSRRKAFSKNFRYDTYAGLQTLVPSFNK